jgi:hypothetical protein
VTMSYFLRFRPLGTALVIAASLVTGAAAAGQLAEWRPVPWAELTDSTRELAIARRALGDTGRVSNVEAFAHARIGKDSMLLLKYVVGEGGGSREVEYILMIGDRIVWRALADEYAKRSAYSEMPPESYHVESCLLLAGDSAIAYLLLPRDSLARQIFAHPAVFEGVYTWNGASHTMEHAGPPNSEIRSRCRG